MRVATILATLKVAAPAFGREAPARPGRPPPRRASPQAGGAPNWRRRWRSSQAPRASGPPRAAKRPNIVLVLADDMRAGDVVATPSIKSLVGGAGMTLRNAFVDVPICAPSRATTLTGQYAQNTGVFDNVSQAGGYQAFRSHGNEAATIGTMLHAAGYRTALIGKYENSYPCRAEGPGAAGLGLLGRADRRLLQAVRLRHRRDRRLEDPLREPPGGLRGRRAPPAGARLHRELEFGRPGRSCSTSPSSRRTSRPPPPRVTPASTRARPCRRTRRCGRPTSATSRPPRLRWRKGADVPFGTLGGERSASRGVAAAGILKQLSPVLAQLAFGIDVPVEGLPGDAELAAQLADVGLLSAMAAMARRSLAGVIL